MNDDEAFRQFLKETTPKEWALECTDLWRGALPIVRKHLKITDAPEGAVLIWLDEDHIKEAVAWAVARHRYNTARKVKETFGAVGDKLEWNIWSQLGMRALAKFLGVPWEQARVPHGQFRTIDGIGIISIKTTGHTDGRLLLHP